MDITDNPTPEAAPETVVAAGPDAGRFSLNDQGAILLQPDSSNPLPGEEIGRIKRGTALLQPAAETTAPSLQPRAQEWLDIHVRQVLEPLFALKAEGEGALTGPAADIGNKLYEHLGVVHRSDLETEIAALDPELRKALRTKGVRLGPVLAFLPALVKPAAIRTRAILWALWNNKDLPIAQPADGRVSEVIDPANVDRHFYRMIGYPVFGPRAIRIDMLDRVVTDVYDTADKGVFEAKHKYAEWLGTNLEDLHSILEAMGHRKLKEHKTEEPVAQTPVEEPVEAPSAEPVADAAVPAEPAVITEMTPKAPVAVQKFFLKKGKMSERPVSRHARAHHKPEEKIEREHKSADKPKFDPNKFSGRKKDDGERPRKKFDKREDKDREAKVYTFEGKKKDGDDDNNPFAILKNLK